MANNKITKELVAQSISQPNAFDNSKTLEKQSSNSLFYKNKGYLKHSCSYWGGTTQKSFRQWEHPKNIIEGKSSQCGTTEKRYGSKNEIQHIGSPTGDIPRPAMLHIYNFKKSFLNTSSKIHNLTISFNYRVVNVTDSGKLWVNNLTDSELAKIQGCQAWFGTWNQSKKFSAVKNNSTVLKYEGKNSKGYNWKTITFTFNDISAADIFDEDFAFNLQFGMNCSKASTPCFLYITGFKIKVTYENSDKYIEGKNNTNVLYTSPDNGCNTTITQTIEAGYKSGNTKLPVAQAPAKLGGKIIVCSAPTGVSVSKQEPNTDTTANFLVTDKTNIPGEKTVTYCLSDDTATKINLRYTAIQRLRPSFQIEESYKSKEDFNTNKSYIVFKDGCASDIKIYTDDINSTPLTLTVANQNSNINLLNQSQVQAFHTHIKNLPCGYHTLYIQRGSETIEEAKNNAVTINVSPMEFKFQIYSETNTILKYQQRKKDSQEHPRYATLKIKRIDDEPKAVIPSVSVIDETNISGVITHLTDFAKGETKDYNIDLYYAGDFYIKIVEDNNPCISKNPSFAKITIESTHKQNYDYLFTRGEDASTFDFDYLVAWEGDNVKSPINMSDINLKHLNDISICSDSANTGLSQIGVVELRVLNKTEDDDFHDVKIELNTLIKNDNDQLEVTTDEWVSEYGMFNNFYELFYEYNLDNNFTVENLTPDNDLVDEENVYIHIKNIPAGETATIYIPYRSVIEKTVFLQFLLFEMPQRIHYFGSCDVDSDDLPTEITLSVTDSMQTQLYISGNTDLLNLDNTYDCPNECYTTVDGINEPHCSDEEIEIDPQSGGVTYTITNVDTNDFSQQSVGTEIINSNEMEPYGFYLDDTYYDLDDENTEIPTRVQISQDTEFTPQKLYNRLIYAYVKFPTSEEEVMIQRTNSKGNAEFFIKIPKELNRSYSVRELLNEIVYFKFRGDELYNPSSLAESQNTRVQYDNIDSNKNNTSLSYQNNYRKYKPGQIAYIPVSLLANIKVIKNKINFYALLGDSGSSDQITVLYRICNIENETGIFKTTFKTDPNNYRLIPQEISKNIYCGVDTDITVYSRLDKEIIEKEKVNVLYINIVNKNKINKNVYVEADLSPKDLFPGDYSFIDVNLDAGDYAIGRREEENDNENENSDEKQSNIIVTWLLGEMQEYQKNKAIIKIRAEQVGLSNISVKAYDYIHDKECDAVIQQNKCPKCNEKTTYTLKNSSWKQFYDPIKQWIEINQVDEETTYILYEDDQKTKEIKNGIINNTEIKDNVNILHSQEDTFYVNSSTIANNTLYQVHKPVWYKLKNGVYYKRIVSNGELIWVMRSTTIE